MSTFTQEEIAALYAPFPLEAHLQREGNKVRNGAAIQWFTYVDRAAVQRRLETLFPGEWSVDVVETYRAADYIAITLKLTIRGISRSCNGGQSLKFSSDSLDEDKEKGAWTEAFRRVASVWGIGLYLYEMDFKIYTDAYPDKDWNAARERANDAKTKFKQWYLDQFKASNGGTSRPVPPPPTTTGQPMPAQPQTSANGNGHDQPAAIVWPSAEALTIVHHRLQGDTGVIDMTMAEFARLCGIDSVDDLDAWKAFESGKAAYAAAMKQFEAEQKPAAPINEYRMVVTKAAYHKQGNQSYLEFQAPGMPRTYGRTTTFRKMVGDAYYNANGFEAMENADKLGKPQTIAPLQITWERKQSMNPDGSVKSDYMLVTDAKPEIAKVTA